MSRIPLVLLLIAIIVGSISCSSAPAQEPPSPTVSEQSKEPETLVTPDLVVPDSSDESAEADDSSGTFIVDQGIFNVDITVPSFLLEEVDEEEIRQTVKENGYTSYRINPDNSVTYTMPKTTWRKILQETKDELQQGILELTEGSEKVDSFVNIHTSDDFSTFDIYVDTEAFEEFDMLHSILFYLAGGFYQSLLGTPADDIDVMVRYIDQATKETIHQGSLREMLELFEEND